MAWNPINDAKTDIVNHVNKKIDESIGSATEDLKLSFGDFLQSIVEMGLEMLEVAFIIGIFYAIVCICIRRRTVDGMQPIDVGFWSGIAFAIVRVFRIAMFNA